MRSGGSDKDTSIPAQHEQTTMKCGKARKNLVHIYMCVFSFTTSDNKKIYFKRNYFDN